MKPYLRLGFLVLFFFVNQKLKAQNYTPGSSSPLNNFINNYAQPAPNAASLGKYADFPVSYYTGIPQIGVPIYDLKDGGINLPISLSYHASGIRVSEIASWVGLGWALNSGGVIIRTVRGAPDEGARLIGGSIGGAGYYLDSGLVHLPKLPYPLPNFQSSDPTNTFYQVTVPIIEAGQKDTEPDLYTFNFNGHVGKFVFDENRHPHLLEDDNLKIRVNFNYTTANFDSWEITTADGIQYYFGLNGNHEVTFPTSTASGSNANATVPSSWYLSKIINPSTLDTATFNYVAENYSYNDLGPESQIYSGDSNMTGVQFPVENATDNSSINFNGNYSVKNFITTGVSGLRLVSIVTKNYTVNFIAKNVRTDLLGGSVSSPSSLQPNSSACSLDSVKILSNRDNSCIRQFALGHTYFVSDTTTGQGILAKVGADVTDTRRLKLISLTEISGDGKLSKPPHLFTYQETYPGFSGRYQLPRRLSYDQDHWGFSNRASGNSNNYFTPKVFYNGQSGVGANRHPSWPDMLAFTLTGVQDPLGATTTFTYGPNIAFNGQDPGVFPPALDSLVGGLRIMQIKVLDNVTGKAQLRSFSYQNGNLVTLPQYLFTVENAFFNNSFSLSGYAGPPGIPAHAVLLKQSQSVVPLQNAQGYYITYPNVRESFGPNGSGGYKTYTFANYASVQNASSVLAFNNFAATGTIQSASPGQPSNPITALYGNGMFNEISQLSLSQNYAGLSVNQNYPFAPQQVDVRAGKLLEEDTYDAANNLLESVKNTYRETYHELDTIRGFIAGPPFFGAPLNSLTYYKLHTGISHLMLSVKQSYLNGHVLSDSTTYGYESAHHTLSTSDTSVNSSGDKYVHKNYYSFDYSNAATTDGVFAKMKMKNLLLPVSSQTWRNGLLINARINQFKDYSGIIGDTLINSGQIYALESNKPASASEANVSPVWVDQTVLLPGANFKPRANFNFNGLTAKPVNEQLTGGSNVSYQWGYNNSYPVAKVQNAADATVQTGTQSAQSIVTLLPMGSTQSYTIPFTIVGGGNVTVELGYSGNPGNNSMAEVAYTLSGPNGAVQRTIPVCVSIGNSGCGDYLSSYTIYGLPAGDYSISASYLQTQNLTSNTNFTVIYPSQSVTNTGVKEFYYEGFEDNSSAITGKAHTGTKYFNGNYIVQWTRPNTRSFVISYWYHLNGKWNYMPEATYLGPAFALTGGDGYDDIRIHPSDADMTTYTFGLAGEMTSSTDPKGVTTYYEYDSFKRLSTIRDQFKNIIKSICYNYAGQQTGCPVLQSNPPQTAASIGTSTFVSPDLMDNEWKQEAPPGYSVAADNGTTINASGNAGANAGRFAYFSTGGTVSPLTYINGNLSFTAKGSGTIEIQLISTYNTTIQARKTFTLSASYQNYNWAISNLYPQLEMAVGVIVNGGNTSAQANVQFQKNFSLDLNQLGMSGSYTRFRADSTSLIGNSEKGWYGWNDNYNAPRKKYLQHSAYARMRFRTTATKIAIEYVRDFYDKRIVNLFALTQVQNGMQWDTTGNGVPGTGAINTYTQVTGGQTYTISGLLTTNPTLVWYHNGSPLNAPSSLTNAGTAQSPVYQVVAPPTATNLGLLIQNTNDNYLVYSNCMIQQGAIGTVTPLDGTIPSAYTAFSGYVPSHISGPAIFINGKLYKYYQVEGNDVAKVIQFVADTLPAGNKTVEVMMPGQGTYLPADPHVRRSGTYLRAVYFPGTETAVFPSTTVLPGSIAYIHDSILSGYNISSDAQNNVWMMMTKRDPSFGFKGDIFSEGYAGRILYTDISTPALTSSFAAKLASFGVDKYWFQIGVNDFGFNTPLPVFYSQYKSLIEQLKVLRPNARMYIQATGPESYEGPNSETVADDGFTSTGPAANDFRDVQRALATSHPYAEYVDFEGLFPAIIANTADGIHPTDAGNILYANGIKNKSTLLGTVLPVTSLSFYRSTTRNMIQSKPGIYTITATGGKTPYTFTKLSGTLPSGLTFNSDGTIIGTPGSSGQFALNVKVTDANGSSVTQNFSLVTDSIPSIVVGPEHIINAQVNVPYSKTFEGHYGYGPYSFAITSGAVPSGMHFNGATCVLSGTPIDTGTVAFTITATDHWGFHGSTAYTLTTGTGVPVALSDNFTVTASVNASNHLILTGHLNDIYSETLFTYIAAYYTPSGGSEVFLKGDNVNVAVGLKDGEPVDMGAMGLLPGTFSVRLVNGGIAPSTLDNVNINYNTTTNQTLTTTNSSPTEQFTATAVINPLGHLIVTGHIPNAPSTTIYSSMGAIITQNGNSFFMAGPALNIAAGSLSSPDIDFGLVPATTGSVSVQLYIGALSPTSVDGKVVTYNTTTNLTLTMPPPI